MSWTPLAAIPAPGTGASPQQVAANTVDVDLLEAALATLRTDTENAALAKANIAGQVFTGEIDAPEIKRNGVPLPPPRGNTDELPEGATNLYYTETRVSTNADVVSAKSTAEAADTKADAAQTDASTAITRSNTAQTAAAAAATAASEAKTTAGAADTKSTAATTSAAAAVASAAAAQTTASAANTKATSAQTTASAADTKATSAQTTASAADGRASSAQSAAAAAQTTANQQATSIAGLGATYTAVVSTLLTYNQGFIPIGGSVGSGSQDFTVPSWAQSARLFYVEFSFTNMAAFSEEIVAIRCGASVEVRAMCRNLAQAGQTGYAYLLFPRALGENTVNVKAILRDRTGVVQRVRMMGYWG